MTETLISVVIPVYNYARTLPRAVESVLAQLDEATADLLVIDGDPAQDLGWLDTPEASLRLIMKGGRLAKRCDQRDPAGSFPDQIEIGLVYPHIAGVPLTDAGDREGNRG
mgnify:CR=1 FL=1